LIFPRLPVLENLVEETGQVPELQDTVLVALQHVLETTGSMFESLFRMGLDPENVFLTGKIYSEHRDTARELQREFGITYIEPKPPQRLGTYNLRLDRDALRLWKEVSASSPDMKKIVALDDGGHLLQNIPASLLNESMVMGVEQTTYGVQTLSPFPVIQVATSAAKSYLEPPLITEAVFKKVKTQIESLPQVPIGVVGLGRIGEAVARGVLKHRENVNTFDKDESLSLSLESAQRCRSLTQLIDRSAVIFGCTGHDISKQETWLSRVRGHRLLISCSSSDVEFRKLLRMAQMYDVEDPLAPLELEIPATGLKLTVLRGGFPINFDRTKESVPAQDIQITRGLLAGAVLQAVQNLPSDGPNDVALSGRLQRRVAHSWFEDQPKRLETYEDDVLEKLHSLDWIREHSGGQLSPRVEK